LDRKQILIADDEKFNIDLMVDILKSEYKILIAKNSTQLFKRLENNKVDLVLLDIVMPGTDGYEVCRLMKKNEQTRDIPVIFITALSNVEEESKGFEAGAVDYIIKPIRQAVLRARVKNQLVLQDAIRELKRLNSLALDANPITGLPGNNSIMSEIKKSIYHKTGVTVIHADLDNFKAYNDKYGFAKGDEIIFFTADTIKKAVEHAKCVYSFIGHIGGDDFVIIVPIDSFGFVAEYIIHEIDSGIRKFYKEEDLAKNCIDSFDRAGRRQCFPLISISMGAVNLTGEFTSYLEVSDVCAETKKIAKSIDGSNIFIDRRGI
jgi:PleD family two-component response regulator